MKIYLIGGKARSGKDTISDFIEEELKSKNKKVCRLQVSSYIKYYAKTYFGWDGSEETKPRELLIKLGTDIIRNKIDENFHINRLLQDIEVLSYFYDYFIISDIRFPVEIEKIKEKYSDVVTIKMIRESDELTSDQKKNRTETSLDDYDKFDYIIENNKSLEDLKERAKEILQEIGD